MKIIKTAKIGSYKAEIIKDAPSGDKFGVQMPLRNGQGQNEYTGHKTLKAAVAQVEAAEDFQGWL